MYLGYAPTAEVVRLSLAEQRSLVGEDGPYTQDVREQLAEAAKIAAVDYVQAQRFRGEFLSRMRALLGTVAVKQIGTKAG